VIFFKFCKGGIFEEEENISGFDSLVRDVRRRSRELRWAAAKVDELAIMVGVEIAFRTRKCMRKRYWLSSG
jgi:hypothetical protein